MDQLAWIAVVVAAAVCVVVALRLVRYIRHESRRIDTLIANADEIIAADREAEIDEDDSRSA